MKTTRSLLVLAALLAGVGVSPPVRAQASLAVSSEAPAQALLLRDDSWYALHLGGAHVGWQHNERRTEQRGEETVVVSKEEIRMEIRRYGSEMVVSTFFQTVESLDGEPLSFTFDNAMSNQRTATRGEFRDGQLHLTVETAGGSRRTAIDWPRDGVLLYGADLKLWKTGLEPGAKIRYPTYVADMGGLVHQEIEVEARRPGGPASLVMRQKEVPGLEVRILLDPDTWEAQEVESSLMQMRMIRTTEAKAKATDRDMPDLGFATMVPVDERIEEPRDVDRVVYRIEAPAEVLARLAPAEDRRQRIVGRKDGAVLLEVRRLGPSVEAEIEEPPPATLAASSYLEVESPVLRETLQEAFGDTAWKELTPEERARRLALWVRSAVDERSLDVGFATAAEVARDRKGDCTEHAVLLAALLRAAGVPSRVRAGLLYLPAKQPVFGFHLWTQAWLPGRGWIDFDATLGDEEADALHLALATSDLSDEQGMRALVAMAPSMGALDLELVEVEPESAPRQGR